MRNALMVLVGAVWGIAVVMVVGYCDMRIDAAAGGAGLDLQTNEVTAVTGVHVPVVSYVVTALSGAATAVGLILLRVTRDNGRAMALIAGVIVGVVSLIVVSFTAWEYGVGGLVDPEGVPFGGGWRGWVEYGGQSPVTHVVAVVGIAAACLGPGLRRRFSRGRTMASNGDAVQVPKAR